MFFPVRDDNPTLDASVATLALIGTNLAAWALVQGLGSEPRLSMSVCQLGAIPGPDCAYLVHGFGHTAKGLRRALGKGASDAQLVTRYETDPLMGGTGMNVNFVTLEREA